MKYSRKSNKRGGVAPPSQQPQPAQHQFIPLTRAHRTGTPAHYVNGRALGFAGPAQEVTQTLSPNTNTWRDVDMHSPSAPGRNVQGGKSRRRKSKSLKSKRKQSSKKRGRK